MLAGDLVDLNEAGSNVLQETRPKLVSLVRGQNAGPNFDCKGRLEFNKAEAGDADFSAGRREEGRDNRSPTFRVVILNQRTGVEKVLQNGETARSEFAAIRDDIGRP